MYCGENILKTGEHDEGQELERDHTSDSPRLEVRTGEDRLYS